MLNHKNFDFQISVVQLKERAGFLFDLYFIHLMGNQSQNYRIDYGTKLGFLKLGVLKNFVNSTGKHLCWSPFLKSCRAKGQQLYQKETSTQLFSCEICKIF